MQKLNDNIIKVKLPTDFGDFDLYGFNNTDDSYRPNLMLVKGENLEDKIPLVRIHSECLTGDVFTSQRCECGKQLQSAMKTINEDGCGIILYLRQEGRGIGLFEKLKAYKLQEEGCDTVDANLLLGHESDARKYDIAAEMLNYINVKKIRLITNNPLKIEGLEENGIEVVERIPSIMKLNVHNRKYMETKEKRMQHILKSR